MGILRVTGSGLIEVATGAAAMGQSTKTMLAQIVADELGGAMERVIVKAGDSGQGTMGFGGFNSRQAVVEHHQPVETGLDRLAKPVPGLGLRQIGTKRIAFAPHQRLAADRAAQIARQRIDEAEPPVH